MWRLAAGLVLSRTGDQLTIIALVWFVLDLTGSGVAVGLVLLCAGLPPVMTGPLLGRVLDRWPLRWVLVADNLLRAVLIGSIPMLHWLERLTPPLVYGLTLAAGALVPATDAGVRVALPRLVEDGALERANLLLSIGDQVSVLVGPAAGGLLVGLVGTPPVLLLDAASFLAMAALVGPLPGTSTAQAAPPSAGDAATRTPLRDPTVRTVLAYFPDLRADGTSPAPVQPRRAAGRTGRLRPALVGVRCRRTARPGDRAAGHLPPPGPCPGWQRSALGLTLLPLLVVTAVVPAMLVLAVGGLIWAPYVTVEASLLQRVTPPAMLGRVFGVRRAVTAAAIPLGAAAGGFLLHDITPTAVIGLSAVTCMLAGTAALCSAGLRRLPARLP